MVVPLLKRGQASAPTLYSAVSSQLRVESSLFSIYSALIRNLDLVNMELSRRMKTRTPQASPIGTSVAHRFEK